MSAITAQTSSTSLKRIDKVDNSQGFINTSQIILSVLALALVFAVVVIGLVVLAYLFSEEDIITKY